MRPFGPQSGRSGRRWRAAPACPLAAAQVVPPGRCDGQALLRATGGCESTAGAASAASCRRRPETGRAASKHDGPRAEPAARTPLHVRPCLGRTSDRPIQWSDGWFCDALRIGWLCRLALFAHCCEHICGQRMSVRRRVPCSRAESVHRVGCGVRERLSRSACACSESAWHMCLHSRTAVMTFEGPAARAGKVVRLHTIILWLGPRKVRPISRVGTLLFGPEPRCWTVFVTLQRCYNVTTFVTCVVFIVLVTVLL